MQTARDSSGHEIHDTLNNPQQDHAVDPQRRVRRTSNAHSAPGTPRPRSPAQGTPGGASVAGVNAVQLLDATFRRAHIAIAITDASGHILEVNDAMCRFLGYSDEVLTTLTFRDITATADLSSSLDGLRQLIDGTASDFVLEKRYLAASGDHVWGRTTGVAVYGDDGSLVRVIAQIEDLSERKQIEAAMGYKDAYDELTGLANRATFESQLQAALTHPRRSASRLALLVVNLDHFHQTNAGLGRVAADVIIVEVARRLRAVTRGHDSVCRLGGDEFAILAPGIASTEDAVGLAIDIRRVLNEPHWPAGNAVFVSARIGVVTSPADGTDTETLVRKATSAAETARSFTSGWAIHQPGDDAANRDELSLVGDLRAALTNNALTIAYQPVVDTHGTLHHFEALARWHHPERGSVAPDQFIVIAEQNGLIDQLTNQVLTGAVEQAAKWGTDLQPVAVAVNLSGMLLADPGLFERITTILATAGLPADRLTLEITETAIADSTNPTVTVTLDRLRNVGVRISIDDFGTGYSSLAYLKQLPVDELKIDRSFITDFDADPRTERIVRSIINLAHSLDLAVVAEGIEADTVGTHLFALGIDYAQGYAIARPASAEVTTAWLTTRATSTAANRPRQHTPRALTVLVIDGQRSIRVALRRKLAQRQHRIVRARDAATALDKLKSVMPDIVIVDQVPQDLTGIETAPQLREAGYAGPIVLFSGSAPNELAATRFPMDVWPISQQDEVTLMRLIDGYAAGQPTNADTQTLKI